ncbi:uncharacterized protein MONBRDRAFT_30927 [Monosiga brevicollis MX1]|uniref:UBA domain-containing protein n=1 Tax=Monosiga brevicollis TaxID=81824 RepID=A9UQ82_MONBE|nr:uncharacterized protein MONBRDRAFT_30927 [Monosiga brevicollis MX1]EDQ93002.1 predicted protein [Monosiga brevicollis MX1]|eukprot:XP_001742764.1 hypothetical protein [Monosiga brevicollis MX1]
MFEGFVSSILNSYLGRYVNNLDPDQLRLAVWNGDVELEGLSLRKDALRGFDLPLDVKAGFLDKLRVQIPWSGLRTRSVVIEIENLHILAGPPPAGDYDAEAEAQRLEVHKQEQLAILEAQLFKTLDDKQAQNGGPAQPEMPASSLVDQVVDNIQVVIKNVHIRFEDDRRHAHTPVAFGIRLDRLAMTSTDANYNPKFVQHTQAVAHKLLDMKNLLIYADVAGSSWTNLINRPYELQQQFKQGGNFESVMQPVSVLGRMRRNRSQGLMDVPALSLEIDAGEIPFVCSKEHLRGLIYIQQTFTNLMERSQGRRRLFRRRPVERIAEAMQHPLTDLHAQKSRLRRRIKAWWTYAAEAVRVTIVKPGGAGSTFRIDPAQFDRWCARKHRYIKLWIRKMTQTSLNTADALDQIKAVRQEQSMTADQTWYGWFFGSAAAATIQADAALAAEPNAETGPEALQSMHLTEEERQELFHELEGNRAPDEEGSTTAIGARVTLNLQQFGLKIVNRTYVSTIEALDAHEIDTATQQAVDDMLLEVRSTNFAFSFEKRNLPEPGFSLHATLGVCELLSSALEPGAPPKTIIGAKSTPPAPDHDGIDATDAPCLSVSLHENLPTSVYDYVLHLHLLPFQVHISPEWLEAVLAYALDVMSAVAPAATDLDTVLHRQLSRPEPTMGDSDWSGALGSTLSLNVDVQAPLVVLTGRQDVIQEPAMVVLDLGRFTAFTIDPDEEDESAAVSSRFAEQTGSSAMHPPYDVAHLELLTSLETRPIAATAAAATDKDTNHSGAPRSPPAPLLLGEDTGLASDGQHTPYQLSEPGGTADAFQTPPSSPTMLLRQEHPKPRHQRTERYRFDISNMQLLAGRGLNYEAVLAEKHSSYHVMDRFTLTLHGERHLAKARTLDEPLFALDGSLERLLFCLSHERLASFRQCATDLSGAMQVLDDLQQSFTPVMTPTLEDTPVSLGAMAFDRAARQAGEEPLDGLPRPSVSGLRESTTSAEGAAPLERLFRGNFVLQSAQVLLVSETPFAMSYLSGGRLAVDVSTEGASVDLDIAHAGVEDLTQEPDSPFRHLVDMRASRLDKDHVFGPGSSQKSPPQDRDDEQDSFFHVHYRQVSRDDSENASASELVGESVAYHFIEIDIDTIVLNLNRESLARLLDFAMVPTAATATMSPDHTAASSEGLSKSMLEHSMLWQPDEAARNSLPRIRVQASLKQLRGALIRNREAVAQCMANQLCGAIKLENDALQVTGSVGQVVVKDPTPAGSLYPFVLSTEGDQMLQFELTTCKLNDPQDSVNKVELFHLLTGEASHPDDCPPMRYFARLKLRMATVRYTHTRRFLTVVSNFASQLQQTQQMLAEMRRVAADVVHEISTRTFESLIALDIEISSPIVTIPRNSFDHRVVEAHLGRTTVSNQILFLQQGQIPDGVSHAVYHHESTSLGIVERLHIQVSNMCFESAERQIEPPAWMQGLQDSRRGSMLHPLRSSNLDDEEDMSSGDDYSDAGEFPLLTAPAEDDQLRLVNRQTIVDNCQFDIDFDRNMTLERRDIPDIRINVHVTDVQVQINKSQFDLILGFLSENFGCEVELLATQDWLELEYGKGLKSERQQSEAEEEPASPVSAGSAVDLDSVGGSAESAANASSLQFFDGPRWMGMLFGFSLNNVGLTLLDNWATETPNPLGRFELIHSDLVFSSMTDGTPRDLGSQLELSCLAVEIYDCRPQQGRAGCYKQVLAIAKGAEGHDPSQTRRLHVTCRLQPTRAEVSVVLNEVRVLLLPQWLVQVSQFAASRPTSGFQELYARHKDRLRGRFAVPQPVNRGSATALADMHGEQQTMLFRCTITQAEFILVNNIMDPRSDVLVLRFCQNARIESSELPGFRADQAAKNKRLRREEQVFRTLRAELNLQNFEIFSCRYDRMSETALAIVDPTHVTASLFRKSFLRYGDMTDRFQIEVDIENSDHRAGGGHLVARLSYNDLALLLSILKQFSDEATASLAKLNKHPMHDRSAARHRRFQADLQKLQYLEEDLTQCLEALTEAGSYEAAAFQLCQRNSESSTEQENPLLGPSSDFTFLQGSIGLSSAVFGSGRLGRPVAATDLLRLGAGSAKFGTKYAKLERWLQAKQQLSAELKAKLESCDPDEVLPVEFAQLQGLYNMCQEAIADIQKQFEQVENEAAILMAKVEEQRAQSTNSSFASKLRYLARLGFAEDDCLLALKACRENVEASTAWLFLNAPRRHIEITRHLEVPTEPKSQFDEALRQSVILSDSSIAVALRRSKNGPQGSEDDDGDVDLDIDDSVSKNGAKPGPGAIHARSGSVPLISSTTNTEPALAVGGPRPVSPAEPAENHELVSEEKGCKTDMSLRARTGLLCFMLIDDYRGRDVPLFELRSTSNSIDLQSINIPEVHTGMTATCQAALQLNHYNPDQSRWEPVLESWPILVKVVYTAEPEHEPVAEANLLAEESMDLTVTPGLVHTVQSALASISEAYSNEFRFERTPFTPYRIINQTGLEVKVKPFFGPGLEAPTEVLLDGVVKDITFDIVGRDQFLSPINSIHKLGITLDGFKPLAAPVAIHRAGTFVHLLHDTTQSRPRTQIYVVIDVVDGRKHITIRSGLLVTNKTSVPLELALVQPVGPKLVLPPLEPDQVCAVPVPYTSANIQVRPHAWGCDWSTTSISWLNYARLTDMTSERLVCHPITGGEEESDKDPFHVCCAISRDTSPIAQRHLPSHVLTFSPPLVIRNCLPLAVHFAIPDSTVTGEIASGAAMGLWQINLAHNVSLRVQIPHFSASNAALIHAPGKTSELDARLILTDRNGRRLPVNLDIQTLAGGSRARVLSLYVDYWLINKTGLPLVVFSNCFHQLLPATDEGDHEALRTGAARMLSKPPGMPAASIRIKLADGHGYCPWVPIESPGSFQTVALSSNARDTKREAAYVGVEVKAATGSFYRTKIVTLIPWYNLKNMTDAPLLACQVPSNSRSRFVELPCGEMRAFHWEQLRVDSLLTVCRQSGGERWHWSPGFSLDDIGTRHLKLYSADRRRMKLVRVDTRIVGAGREIIFSDADATPPFVICNDSNVPVEYRQQSCQSTYTVLPGATERFAWDDLSAKTLRLELRAMGGRPSRFVACDIQRVGDSAQLHYTQDLRIVGPSGLVVTAEVVGVRDREPPFLKACLNAVDENDLHQLWRWHGKQLINKAGYFLEATRIGISSSQVRLRQASTPNVSDVSEWRVQEGRLACNRQVELSSNTQMEGRPYALEASFDESTGPQAGTYLIVNTSATLRPPKNQQFALSPFPAGSGAVDVVVRAQGQCRMINLTDALEGRHDDAEMAETSNSGKMMAKGSLNLKGGIGLSLVSSAKQEILYISSRDVALEGANKGEISTLDLAVGQLQIDNQLSYNTRYPVMLQRINTPSRQGPRGPLLRMHTELVIDPASNTTIVRQLVIKPNSLRLAVEDTLIFALGEFVNDLNPSLAPLFEIPENSLFYADSQRDLSESMQHQLEANHLCVCLVFATCCNQPTQVCDGTLTSTNLCSARHDGNLFFESVLIETFKLELTLKNMSRPTGFKLFTEIFKMLLLSIDECHFDMSKFELHLPFVTADILGEGLQTHYRQLFVQQWYRGALSLTLLGTPTVVVGSLYEGVRAMLDDVTTNQDVIGGGLNLLSHVSSGVAYSTSKFTQLMGDQLTRASFDSEFVHERDRAIAAARDQGHLATGLGNFGYSLVSAVEGVVSHPAKGLKKGGAVGLVKGLFKGAAGVLTKPASGVMDLVSETAAAMSGSRGASQRMRLPRAIGPDEVVRPYNIDAARGQSQLRVLLARPSEERFVHRMKLGVHLPSVIITSERVIGLNELPGRATISFELWFRGVHKFDIVQGTLPNSVHKDQVYVDFWVSAAMLRHTIKQLEMQATEALKLDYDVLHDGPRGRMRFAQPCDTLEIATEFKNQLRFAIDCFEEAEHRILHSHDRLVYL